MFALEFRLLICEFDEKVIVEALLNLDKRKDKSKGQYTVDIGFLNENDNVIEDPKKKLAK